MIINLYAIIIMPFTHQDTECLAIALILSQFGRKAVGANPILGCVISRDVKIISQYYDRPYGDCHAALNALEYINYKG
mgnify:CR=1 FL=1